MSEIYYHYILNSWTLLAILVFFLLFFVKAPFGRHTSTNWGPMINARLAWVIMELASPLFFAYFFWGHFFPLCQCLMQLRRMTGKSKKRKQGRPPQDIRTQCHMLLVPRLISKSVARGGGRTSYRGLVQVQEGAHHSKSTVKCDALLVDTISRSDTYPYVDIREDDVSMGHEATVSKISDDQLFYLMSRGLTEDEAMAMIVRGFIEPIARELPMEYALELNRLIELQMEGAVG